MAESIGKRNQAKASTAKPSGKPPPSDKSLWLEPDIRFCFVKEGYKTEYGEEAEILIIHD